MKQPGLGKKVTELRLEMGLTQSELAEKCNVSLRTIQRIEAAEVTPRSYTLKTIFQNLNYQFYNTAQAVSKNGDDAVKTGKALHIRLYEFMLDLFNLKTNTMKKVTILSITFFAIIFGISAAVNSASAQSADSVKKIIEGNNKEYVKWFNNGDIQSLATLYHNDACIISKGCGKDFITKHFTKESAQYKLLEMKTLSVSLSDNLAVEKGSFKVKLESGQTIGGEYLVEWKLADKKWLIMSESTEVGSLNEGGITRK